MQLNFGEEYQVAVPWGDPELELEDDSSIAILNLVTVRARSYSDNRKFESTNCSLFENYER